MTETIPDKPAVVKSRIFLVDDHEMFREGLRQLIEREPDMTVCGDAANASTALVNIESIKPDLVIVDISLGGSSGIDLVKIIRNKYEDLPVLVVSMHEESLYAERALRAGAMGYVMKHEPSKTVKTAIRKVLDGNLYLSEKMAGSMVTKLIRGGSEQSSSPLESLSERELQVFRMLGQGKSVRTIAEEMNVSVPTVNSFRNRVREKLNLKSSTDVMLQAIQWAQDQKTM
jgi:DNA-binding NarL/FixJ family response regulator